MSRLDIPPISRLRRNHGLEHATLHILSSLYPTLPLGGYSTPGGFFLFGEVPTDELRAAVFQALDRMNRGERSLAIHEHCGTNLVVTGVLAGFLVWLGMAGASSKRSQLQRLPLAISLAALVVVASQPLGPLLQARVTTSGEPAGLSVVDIFPVRFGPLVLHRVITQG
jgi:hypothetical protein